MSDVSPSSAGSGNRRRSSVQIKCLPRNKSALPERITDVYTSGNDDGDVTLVGRDGVKVQAHQVLYIFKTSLNFHTHDICVFHH